MAFWGTEFIFDDIPCSEFGLMVYHFGSNGQDDVSFKNGEIIEDRIREDTMRSPMGWCRTSRWNTRWSLGQTWSHLTQTQIWIGLKSRRLRHGSPDTAQENGL